MILSTHYYVLSLSSSSNCLFEAFRDSLFEIENQGFPARDDPVGRSGLGRPLSRTTLETVDHCLGSHQARSPLNVVVTGTPELQTAFRAVTVHGDSILATVDGDHAGTAPRDLGQIAWPLVREAMSRVGVEALGHLGLAESDGQLISGLDAVARVMDSLEAATLLLERDYHCRGSIRGRGLNAAISREVDIRDVHDDVVDTVIDEVLAFGGKVVFLPPGTLSAQQRIVLLAGQS